MKPSLTEELDAIYGPSKPTQPKFPLLRAALATLILVGILILAFIGLTCILS